MELLIKSIQMDWAVLLPIFICSILTIGVALNRLAFYNDNKRDVVSFIRSLRVELVKNNWSGAQLLSAQLGGVTGELAEEGIRILEEQNGENDFAASFDISTSFLLISPQSNDPYLPSDTGLAPNVGAYNIRDPDSVYFF